MQGAFWTFSIRLIRPLLPETRVVENIQDKNFKCLRELLMSLYTKQRCINAERCISAGGTGGTDPNPHFSYALSTSPIAIKSRFPLEQKTTYWQTGECCTCYALTSPSDPTYPCDSHPNFQASQLKMYGQGLPEHPLHLRRFVHWQIFI